jgi:integrase
MNKPKRFTTRFVEGLKPFDKRFTGLIDKTGRYTVREDGGSPGTLSIRVSPKGLKTWEFHYRYRGENDVASTVCRLNLGRFPQVTLANANSKVAEAREKLERGVNPKAREVDDTSVEALCEEYLKNYAKPRKRTWETDQRVLHKEVIPKWHNRRASSIARRDVAMLLNNISKRAPVMSNRTRTILIRLFGWAVQEGYLEDSPARNLPSPAPERPRDVVLSHDQIKSFWHGLDNVDTSELVKIGLKLILVVGQRRAEVIGMRKKELDFDRRIWSISAERMKSDRSHAVPLTDIALELIERALELSPGSPWVFPTNFGGKTGHFHPASLGRVMRQHRSALGLDEKEAPSTHDLRRTCATEMGAAGVPNYVIAKVLAHADRSITGRIYNRHSFIPEMRVGLEAWERRLGLILHGVDPDTASDDANVVPLRVQL